MQPKLEETIYLDCITSNGAGAAVDADSAPTVEVFEDANDTAILSLTMTKRTSKTGNYRVAVACTAANGFEAAKSYNVIASATVTGVAAKLRLATIQMRLNDIDYVADLVGRVPVAAENADAVNTLLVQEHGDGSWGDKILKVVQAQQKR